ncbi:hypothetical protein Fot_32755 [Forsythia ovata]|uniref:Uncharacterized protein n=1 Tax=Forsythia ovata TaxID=205694 RepID=A0ABD1T981_9LAMI
MDEENEVKLLQIYRRDRRVLLDFILAGSLIKKVIMPPRAVKLDDVDLDQVCVDYVLNCAKKGGMLELSEAIRDYHDSTLFPNMPLDTEEVEEVSSLSKSQSLNSSQVQELTVDDIDEFEDDDPDEVDTQRYSRRVLNDASDVVLGLPSFATGKFG